MSDKHLAKGDDLPPLGDGKLRLFSMRYCPFAQRSRLVLLAKGIEHEIVNVNLSEKPDWFFERNPLGKVPILEFNGKIIYESLIVCDYLDEVYPEKPLHPKDPYVKARHRILLENYDAQVIPNYYKYLRSKFEDQEALDALHNGLEKLEHTLKDTGNYFGGDQPGMLDYMVWPWIERFPIWGEDKALPKDRFPSLSLWFERMQQDPAVQTTLNSARAHINFYASYQGGKVQYDPEE